MAAQIMCWLSTSVPSQSKMMSFSRPLPRDQANGRTPGNPPSDIITASNPRIAAGTALALSYDSPLVRRNTIARVFSRIEPRVLQGPVLQAQTDIFVT